MTLELKIEKILDQLAVQDEYFYAAMQEATTKLEALVREREEAAVTAAFKQLAAQIVGGPITEEQSK